MRAGRKHGSMGAMLGRTGRMAWFAWGALAALGCGGDGDSPSTDSGVDAAQVLQPDSGGAPSDASMPTDAQTTDSGASDAGRMDAGPDCTFVMPSDCVTPDGGVLPQDLRCTGLYARFDAGVLACNVRSYAPAYELWSDGAKKARWVFIPADKKIDTTDPGEPVYPVGTKFWKEFRSSDGAKLLETRLLQKNETGWVYTSYVWTADGTNAVQQNDGVMDLHGTGHVVPTRDQCDECHRGRKDKILGWDSFMLGTGAQGVTREDLVRLGYVESGKELPNLTIPGDAVERAALGYLHANCGISCHNNNLRAKARDTGLMLRLEPDMLSSAPATPAVRTGLFKQPGTNSKYGGISTPDGGAPRDYFRDFVPRDTKRSLSLVRMVTRGGDGEMPSIGSKRVDDAGVEIVRAWIEQMTPERGYPQTPDAGP